jgi:hypothetical protein
VADRKLLEGRLKAVERQMQSVCVFSKKYRELEKERQKLLRLLRGRR